MKNARKLNFRAFCVFLAPIFWLKALKIKGWHPATKKIKKTPQANQSHDDNYYVGSLGHNRR